MQIGTLSSIELFSSPLGVPTINAVHMTNHNADEPFAFQLIRYRSPLKIDPLTYSLERIRVGPNHHSLILRFQNASLSERYHAASRLAQDLPRYTEFLPHLVIVDNLGTENEIDMQDIALPTFPLEFVYEF